MSNRGRHRVGSIVEEDDEDDAWGEDEDTSTDLSVSSKMSSLAMKPHALPKDAPQGDEVVAPPRPSLAMKMLKKKASKTSNIPKTINSPKIPKIKTSVAPSSKTSSKPSSDNADKAQELEKEIAKLSAELSAAIQAKDAAEAKLDTDAKAHSEKSARVTSDLEQKVATFQSDLNEKTETLSLRDAEIISLKKSLDDAASEAKSQKQKYEEEISTLRSQVQMLRKDKETMKVSLEMAERRMSVAGSKEGSFKDSDKSANLSSPSTGMMQSMNTNMFSKEISRLNYELKVAMKDKEKALALVIDLVGKKRLVRYLDEHGREENALRSLKKLVRRGSPDKARHNKSGGSPHQHVVPRSDQGAWWSTRDLHEVSSARSDGHASLRNSPESQYGTDSQQRGGSARVHGKSRRKRLSPRNKQYDELLHMAHDRAVAVQTQQRPPFVSTGRRQSLFSNLRGNGHVENSRAVVEQAAQEYRQVAGDDYYY